MLEATVTGSRPTPPSCFCGLSPTSPRRRRQAAPPRFHGARVVVTGRPWLLFSGCPVPARAPLPDGGAERAPSGRRWSTLGAPRPLPVRRTPSSATPDGLSAAPRRPQGWGPTHPNEAHRLVAELGWIRRLKPNGASDLGLLPTPDGRWSRPALRCPWIPGHSSRHRGTPVALRLARRCVLVVLLAYDVLGGSTSRRATRL